MVEEGHEAAIPQRLISMARRTRRADSAIEPVIRAHRRQHPKANAALVRRAYATAKFLHEGQSRKYRKMILAAAADLRGLGDQAGGSAA